MSWIRRSLASFTHMSLARKLILIHFILIVLPLGTLSFFANASISSTMEKKVGEYQLQTLKQLTLNIDTYMNELNRLTLMPYQYNEIMAYIASEREAGQPLTLEEIEMLNNFVSKVFLNGRIDILGVSLYGENGASYVVLPESQYVTSYTLDDSAEWLKQTQGRRGKPIFITTHEVKSIGGTSYEVFSIARELRSFDTGQTLGYIVIDIDLSHIGQLLEQVTLGKRESIFLVDNQGNPVILKGQSEFIAEAAVLGGEGVSHIDGDEGRLLSAYVTSPVTEWTTVGVVPVSELMGESLLIRRSIVWVGALCVGLAMLFSVFIAFRITKPLRKLRQLMRKVEYGDLNVSFPVMQRDEVGHLGMAFNMMVSKLSELGYLLYETEIREKDAQIAALQSKMNPHFLYNTLGSISMYAEVEGNREIAAMADNLGRLLRYSLRGHQQQVTLRDELAHVQGYMTIQKIRYEDRIDFTMDMDECLLDCKVIPLMIQPVVENAIQHGIDKGAGQGRIRLAGKAADGELCITVEDDGIGMTQDQLERIRARLQTADLGEETGNGLLNVHRRIRLHFGEKYGIRLQSMPYQGLKVQIMLPIIHVTHDSEGESHAESVAR